MRPLIERCEKLAEVIAGIPGVLLVTYIRERGEELYDQVCAAQLEGVIAKKADSPYLAGRSPLWVKIPRPGAVPAQRFAHSRRSR